MHERWAWLGERFGAARLLDAPMMLPTPAFFRRRYDGSDEAILYVFERIKEALGVEHARFVFAVADEDGYWVPMNPHDEPDSIRNEEGFHASAYGGTDPVVVLHDHSREEPMQLIGQMAHELAHIILIGGGHQTGAEDDHERTADLLTVFFGLGVLAANSAVVTRSWEHDRSQGFNSDRTSELTQEHYGYALALFARAKRSRISQMRAVAWRRQVASWSKFMGIDIRTYFKRSVKFLTHLDRNVSRSHAIKDRAAGRD